MLGEVPIRELLVRSRIETPAYFYDLDAIQAGARALKAALSGAPHLLAYAVKANSAGSVLRTIAREGLGADVVSGNELELVLAAGFRPELVVMSGVAKTDAEIDLAIASGIRAIQTESVEEIERVAARARAVGRVARIAVRVKPSVDIDSHAHIRTGHDDAKFGVALADLPAAFARIDAAPDALLHVGLSVHVGSMLASVEPYLESANVLAGVARARRAQAPGLEYVNFGGGIGIDYGGRPCEPPPRFAEAALGLLKEAGLSDLTLVLEPGRALVAPYGVLVARVVQPKISGDRRWLMIDAGMNDLIRPALYSAHHRVEPLDWAPGGTTFRVVGPVCESSDDFGTHPIGDRIPDYVVIRDAGAYGFVMASEYNGRPLPAEVFVAGGEVVSVSPSPGGKAWIERRLSA